MAWGRHGNRQLEPEAERAQLQPQKQAERVTWEWRQKSTLLTFPPVNLCLLRFHNLPNTGPPRTEGQVFKYESHGGTQITQTTIQGKCFMH